MYGNVYFFKSDTVPVECVFNTIHTASGFSYSHDALIIPTIKLNKLEKFMIAIITWLWPKWRNQLWVSLFTSEVRGHVSPASQIRGRAPDLVQLMFAKIHPIGHRQFWKGVWSSNLVSEVAISTIFVGYFQSKQPQNYNSRRIIKNKQTNYNKCVVIYKYWINEFGL